MTKLLSEKSNAANEENNLAARNEMSAKSNRNHTAPKKSAIKAFGENLIKYRFIISCTALFAVMIAAAVIVMSGKHVPSAHAMGYERMMPLDISLEPTGNANYETPTPEFTAVPTVCPSEEPEADDDRLGFGRFKLDDENGFPIIETPEPYVEITTEVPSILAVPIEDETRIIAKYGVHDPLIPAVQEKLMLLWYMDQDEPTDYFGRVTRSAIEVFQRRSDLPVTGELDAKTYNMLFDIGARAYLCTLGDKGADVNDIQSRLYELGYLSEKSGVFDEATFTAVTEFQKLNSLHPDGKVGRGTREKLYDPECKANILSMGDAGERILHCQNRLAELGYLTTTPDGVYGTDTQMAVRRFQANNQLIVDGYLGPVTYDKLMSETAFGNALSYAMQGTDVLNVQKRLYELNYLNKKDVNSYFTSLTEAAVKLFQKNNGLQQDGRVGSNTMSVLMSDNAVRAKAPVEEKPAATPTPAPTAPPAPSTSSNSGNSNSGGSNSGGSNSGGSNSGGSNSGGSSSVDAKINNFLYAARTKLGCKYVRGGKGPSVFDCSGFVYWALNRAGVSQSYMTSYMWRSCKRYQRNNNINNVKKGDVIVYYGHVAICTGKWTQIDASQSQGKIVERSFNSSYWYKNFICSFRIFT